MVNFSCFFLFFNQKVRLKIDATFALQNTLNMYEQIISGADMYQRLNNITIDCFFLEITRPGETTARPINWRL